MAFASVRTWLGALEEVRQAFSRPGFLRYVVVAAGWVRVQGLHTLTGALVAAGAAGRRHHEAFHRLFSRGAWSADVLGRLLLLACLALLPEGAAVLLALDDTLCPKRGPHVFGIGSHRDAVLSSARHKVLRFGHVWVVLALVVRLPCSERTFALPVLLRLYRTRKECAAHGAPFRTKTQLADEMLHVVAGWLSGRPVRLVMDGAYCCEGVVKNLPEGFVAFGAMRPDAALTRAPPKRRRAGQRGRGRKRGAPLPSPKHRAAHGRWKRQRAHLYGQDRRVALQAWRAQWYRVAGPRLLSCVVVRTGAGGRPFRTFFCTDAHVPPCEVLEVYALRWSLEVTFRELKQLLGFADSPARTPGAVLHTAPFVALLYTQLVLAFARRGARASAARALRLLPPRPWYRHKAGICFEDILRAARAGLQGVDVLRPALYRPPRQKHKPRARPPSGLLLAPSG